MRKTLKGKGKSSISDANRDIYQIGELNVFKVCVKLFDVVSKTIC